jgi:cytochrome c1
MEYWNARLLSRFIANPGSLRAGTKMPNFDSLGEKDIQAIVQYLQSTASHKKPGTVCP